MSCTGIIRHAPFSACPLSLGTIFWSSPMLHVPVTHSFSGAQRRNYKWICQFIQSLLFLGVGCYEQRCYISLPNNVLNILVSRGQTPGNGAVEQECGCWYIHHVKDFCPPSHTENTGSSSTSSPLTSVLNLSLSGAWELVFHCGSNLHFLYKNGLRAFFFIWSHLVTYILSFIKLLLKEFFSF